MKSNLKPPETIRLDNGILLIAEEMPSALSCTLSIWVDAGSIDENASNNGISHFIEHIVFKGTNKRSALEIAEESENFGANLNGFTDREHTCYHTRILSEHLPVVLELFLDMLFNPRLDDKDFDIERLVILEEIKMYEDSPEDLVQDFLYEIIWKDHPLGKPITGTVKSISHLKKEQVAEYLNNFYTPDNIVISVAGKFSLDKVVKQVEKFTKSINKKNKKVAPPPLIITPDIFIKSKEIEQSHLNFATKGVSVFDEARYALAVIDIAIGGGMSSRLFQEIREKRGLAYSISSYYNTNRLGGLFGIYAATTSKDANFVTDLILKEISDIKKNGLKSAELERAKMQLKTSLFLELESTKVRSFRNALYSLYYKKFLMPEEINKSIQFITNEKVIELANNLFDSKYFTITLVGPKSGLPTQQQLHDIINAYN